MHITAVIRRQSHVYKNWHGLSRIGGTLDGVYFHTNGLNYVAKNVSPDKLDVLERNPAVLLEIVTTPVGAVSSVPYDLESSDEEHESAPSEPEPTAYMQPTAKRDKRPYRRRQ
jgi:hypothetical protein